MTYRNTFSRRAFLPVLLVIVPIILSGCSQGSESSGSQPASASTQASAISETSAAPAAAGNAQSDTATAPSVVAFAPMAGAAPSQSPNTQCAIDRINDQPAASTNIVKSGTHAYLGGWVGDGNLNALGNGVFILKGAEASYSIPFSTGDNRPDLVKAFGAEGMANAGFHVEASLDNVRAGTYALLVEGASDVSTVCNFQRTLEVQ